MKTNIHFWSYLPQFFLGWEMFRTKVVENIKTHILCSITCFRKSCLYGENWSRNGQATDANITGHKRIGCWITKAKNVNSEYVILIAFPLQQWLHEDASLLRYAYIDCHLIWNVTKCLDSKPCPSVLITSSWRRKDCTCLFNTPSEIIWCHLTM